MSIPTRMSLAGFIATAPSLHVTPSGPSTSVSVRAWSSAARRSIAVSGIVRAVGLVAYDHVTRVAHVTIRLTPVTSPARAGRNRRWG
jgi:hypothetical protein